MVGTVVGHCNKSARDLFDEGTLQRDGFTLREFRDRYNNPNSEVRESFHAQGETPSGARFGIGERFADIILKEPATELPRGGLRVTYVQRPGNLISLGKRVVDAEGGNRIVYDCPTDGWAVPRDGLLWHPVTGAAIDTLPYDRYEEAVRLVARYIESHEHEFSRWEIPERWSSTVLNQCKLMPLAVVETTYQTFLRRVTPTTVYLVLQGYDGNPERMMLDVDDLMEYSSPSFQIGARTKVAA